MATCNVAETEWIPLSAAQRGRWLAYRMAPERQGDHNIVFAARIEGHLCAEVLRSALAQLAARHAVLRLRIVEHDGIPHQRFIHDVAPTLHVEDVTGWNEAALQQEIVRATSQPFLLEQEAPYRAALYEQEAGTQILTLAFDHIAVDGWSFWILLEQLGLLLQDAEASLGVDLDIDYPDYVGWQRDWLSSERAASQRSHWNHVMASLPPALQLPVDRKCQDVAGETQVVPVWLAPTLTTALRALARRHGASIYTVLLSAWQIFLHRITGQAEIAVGSPMPGRSGVRWDHVVGDFVNPVALVARFTEDTTVQDVLRQARNDSRRALRHQDYPYSSLVEDLRGRSGLSTIELFQTMFVYQHARHGAGMRALWEECQASTPIAWAGLHLRGYPVARSGGETFPLMLEAMELETGVRCDLRFNPSIYERETIAEWSNAWVHLLGSMASDETQKVYALELMPPRPASTSGGMAGCAAVRSALEGFRHWAAVAPEAIALVDGDVEVTYAELARRASQIARRLAERGVGRGDRVALCLPRGTELVAAMLATWEAGAAYVPLDPDYPRARLAYMLDDSLPACVVVSSASDDVLPTRADVDRVVLPGTDVAEADVMLLSAANAPKSDDVAYLIYTSGSTGEPKGVAVTHGNLAAQVSVHIGNCALAPGQRMLQFASASFDSSVVEIFPTLSAGATLVFRPETLLAPDAEFAAFLASHRIDTVDLPTAFWNRWAIALRDGAPSPSVRRVVVGGEKVERRFFDAWSQATACPVLNTYGPTETTVYATAMLLEQGALQDGQDVPIGHPVGHTEVHVLDRWGAPVPVGVVGELYIAGPQVALGYWNRPELTSERFVRDGFVADPRARMYRTGDLGRRRADGILEYVGRTDFQVKIRGFRIEPGEIEARLAAFPGVDEAVVLAREDVHREKRLVAYVVPRQGAAIGVAQLRRALAAELAAYMLPAAYVVLSSLPLTPNGKIDRAALPEPGDDAVVRQPHQSPCGPVEQRIADVWCALLGLRQVGRYDDFFELGGHSLSAAQAASRLREALGCEVRLRDLFTHPRLFDLAAFLARADESAASVQVPVALAAPRPPALPMSWAQQRLWFLDQLDPAAGAAYHMPVALRLSGVLDDVALLASLDRVVSRHEILRTGFVSHQGDAVQVVSAPDTPFCLRAHDLRGQPADQQAVVLASLRHDEAHVPFDLARGPLIRGSLVRLADEEHVLLMTQHHIVSDGWSINVLINEINSLYAAFRAGQPDPLPPLPLQYADYALWQRSPAYAEGLRDQVEYWRRQLRGAPILLELPVDRPRPAVQRYAGACVPVQLSAGLCDDLTALSRRHGTTVFMTLLAGWSMLLSRLSGQAEVVVGTPVANRVRPELEPLIGFFVNTLALRVDVGGAADVADLLAQVKATTLGAYEHQDLPFEQVVEAVQPVRSMSHSPLFQVMLSFDNTPGDEALSLPGLQVEQLQSEASKAHFDMELSLRPESNRIIGELSYATDLFDASTAERHVACLEALLQALCEHEGALVSLPWLSSPERERVLEVFNATSMPRPMTLIHHAFEEQARATPDAVALECGGVTLCYAELNRRANQVAHRLAAVGAMPDARVAICAERGLDMVVGLLGILKSGAAYVPLDPTHPRERLAGMLADCAPTAVLAQPSTLGLLPQDAQVPTLVLTARVWEDAPTHDLQVAGLTPQHLAYVIYTSGSTGQPKGVMNEHHAVMNRLHWGKTQFPWMVGERVLHKTPFGFDVSVWEIFQPLLSGARLVLAQPQGHQDPDYLIALIESAQITVAHFVPSMLQAFLDRLPVGRCAGLRQIFCSGEALGLALAAQVRSKLPQVELHNLYGPTEAAIEVTWWNCAEGTTRPAVLIGRPIANTRMYVLDGQGEPVPVGVAGELCIGGVQVARGYWNRAQLSAERFVPDRFSADPQARMYRTGDLGRWRADGTIEYLGRNDFQVKIRGFRIELGEIEAQLLACADVREAVVVARAYGEGDTRLVAYVVMAPGVACDVSALRQALLQRLAEYMVPSAFVALEALPLTANGKLDRQALPSPETAAVAVRAYEAPHGEIEEAIAAIWQDLLGVERVGRHDHFFELGGHSLLAVQVASRLRERFGVSVPVASLFQAAQLSALSALVVSAIVEQYPQDAIAAHADALEGLSADDLRALLETEDA